METLFGFNAETVKDNNMGHTTKEIARQPKVWKSIYEKISSHREEIKAFMAKFDESTRIIFAGAGSSGFIGDSLAPIIRKDFMFKDVESIHTTDIVGNPEQYLIKDVKTVMVSFGRSGNSPESVAAVELAEQFIEDISHIIITCNPEGKLAKFTNERTLNLTFSEIEDLGFAMTSSVTGMMLAAYSVFGINNNYTKTVDKLSGYAQDLIDNKYTDIFNAFNNNVNRLVVLGSANLFGAAREGALKSTELTAGQIATGYDTPMGFRHGPKSFLNKNTVIIFFVSNNEYTRKYDLDMLNELSHASKHKLVVISDKYYEDVEQYTDIYLYNGKEEVLEEAFTPYIPIVAAQIFSLNASLSLGCTPDNPFPSGEVNRVVKGVVIHKF